VTITDGYATQLEAKAWLNISDASLDDLMVDDLVNAASRAVDGWCGRSFTADTVATAQQFLATDMYLLELGNDIADTSTAIVKTSNGQDGVFGTTLTVSTQYVFEPLNGVVGGVSGWPATRIRLIKGAYFPTPYYGRAQVEVTAKWGWAAVPAPVKQATLQLVAELWKRKDAPFGVLGGQEFGTIYISPDAMRSVGSLLRPYRTGELVAPMA